MTGGSERDAGCEIRDAGWRRMSFGEGARSCALSFLGGLREFSQQLQSWRYGKAAKNRAGGENVFLRSGPGFKEWEVRRLKPLTTL